MSKNDSLEKNTSVLGIFASLLGVLGIFIYFTGWIYRWAYFSFFQIEVTTLEFPLESFLIVPIQVFIGNISAFWKSLLSFVLIIFCIRVTLSVSNYIHKYLLIISEKFNRRRYLDFSKQHHSRNSYRIAKELQLIANFISHPLREEIVTVSWVLIILFFLARHQGIIDARRDAINNTSTRPVITLIVKSDDVALGRNLNDLLTNPSLKDYRIFGDKGLFDNIRGQELNDNTYPNQPIIWRLLIKNNDWIYLFKTLPANATNNQRPFVLAIRESESGNQLLILSPEASKEDF